MVLTRLRWDFPQIPEWSCYVWAPLHLPLGIALVSYVVASLFPEAQRRTAFLNLACGGALHLAVDVLQRHFGMGYLLLVPFSDWDFEFGWMGSEATVTVVPWLLPLTALAAWARWRRPTVPATESKTPHPEAQP